MIDSDGRVIASCMAGSEGHGVWVSYLAAIPEAQNQGFAKAIMEQAERLLIEAGITIGLTAGALASLID